MAETYVGFDIGGTKTLAILVDREFEVLATERRPRPRSREAAVDQVSSLLDVFTDAGHGPVRAIGVGIAGAISRDGTVVYSPNIQELYDFPLGQALRERLGVPVAVDNDATAATVAEHRIGAGRGVEDLLYVALGTGIGVGYVLDGSVYRGANGFAGESGHMVVDRHGARHVSGARGPWELYASGTGLGRLTREALAEGRLPSLVSRGLDADSVRGEDLSAAIADGHTDAVAVLADFADDVALGLTNLIYILDPTRIVIGGGLADIGEPLRAAVQAAVENHTIGGDFRPQVPIHLAELGSTSAALGAAMLAADLS